MDGRCQSCDGTGLVLEADDWGPDVTCARCTGTGRAAPASAEEAARRLARQAAEDLAGYARVSGLDPFVLLAEFSTHS